MLTMFVGHNISPYTLHKGHAAIFRLEGVEATRKICWYMKMT